MGRRGKPIADSDGKSGDRRRGALEASGFARLLASGVLDRAGPALKRRLAAGPRDDARWLQFGDIERSRGDLDAARRYYARAARAGAPDGEAGALAALLAGEPMCCEAPGTWRFEPFLVRPSPLSPELLRALLPGGTPGAQSHPGRIGADRRYDPTVREARARAVPAALLPAVLDACGPLAREAASRLFRPSPELTGCAHTIIDYTIGGGYRAHRDVFSQVRQVAQREPTQRVLTLVVYLAVEEAGFSGGDLLLHDRSGNAATRLRPRAGMAVAFPASALHEVTRLEGPGAADRVLRTALTLWYNSAATAQR